MGAGAAVIPVRIGSVQTPCQTLAFAPRERFAGGFESACLSPLVPRSHSTCVETRGGTILFEDAQFTVGILTETKEAACISQPCVERLVFHFLALGSRCLSEFI